MIKAVACVIGLAFVGVLIWSAMHIFDKDTPEPKEQTDFVALLDDEAALNVYTYPCKEAINQAQVYDDFFGAEEQVPPDSKAREARKKRCLEHRNEQLKKWSSLSESANSKDILARAFFYKGNLQYADAYDNRSIESANLAVQSLEASLGYEPGFIEEGFSGFDYNRRELIERARNLRGELMREEEQKERKKKRDQALEQEESKQNSGKKGEVDGIEVPIMEQGVQP